MTPPGRRRRSHPPDPVSGRGPWQTTPTAPRPPTFINASGNVFTIALSSEAGRARLRKYIVTEQVQTSVPVTREKVRVEREPITDAHVGKAMSGPELFEEEHEVVLHEEEPVVEKKVVPKERVRLPRTRSPRAKERIEEDTR